MHMTRFPLILASLGILLPGGEAFADAKCELAAGYLLEYEDEIEFGVSIHRCTDFWRLEFEEFGGRLADGEPIWNVVDLLEAPKVATDEIIVSQTCLIGGVEDKGIVVVAQQTDEDWFAKIRIAWRADRERRQWKSVDPRGPCDVGTSQRESSER